MPLLCSSCFPGLQLLSSSNQHPEAQIKGMVGEGHSQAEVAWCIGADTRQLGPIWPRPLDQIAGLHGRININAP